MSIRLLHVRDLTFHSFLLPDLPEYVITSHRWRGDEAMLKDIQKKRNTNTSGYKKVEGFAKYIRANLPGIEYMWIDTCCIDQKSSQEVSEAINSMYRYYRDAEICLAYLADVDDCEDVEQFKASSWHTRGWTLQELLAPRVVRFLDQHWALIGYKGPEEISVHPASTTKLQNKMDSAGFLVDLRDGIAQNGSCINAHITAVSNIPQRVLLTGIQASRPQVSMVDRIRWASGRETTRDEDLAYCLLGLTGATMPVIYGEGYTKAMSRLLLEVGGLDPKLVQTLPLQNEIEVLYRKAKPAAQLLFLMSCCERSAIPGLILRAESSSPTASDGNEMEKLFGAGRWQDTLAAATAVLMKHSYVTSHEKDDVWTLSQDIQTATVDWLLHTGRFKYYRDLVVERLLEAIPPWEDDRLLASFKYCDELNKQVLHLEIHASDDREQILKRATILYRFSWFLWLREEGQNSVGQQIIPMAEKSRALRSADLGADDPDTVRSRMLVAICKRDFSFRLPKTSAWGSGNYATVEIDGVKRALQALKELTQIRNDIVGALGQDHSCVFECRLHIITTCIQAGQTKEALDLARKAHDFVTSMRRSFNLSILDVCHARCVFGQMYIGSDLNASAARMHLREALEERENVQSLRHPDALQNKYLLAKAYMDEGEYTTADLSKAETLLLEVSASYKELLGHNHSRTKAALSTMAEVQALRSSGSVQGEKQPGVDVTSSSEGPSNAKSKLWGWLKKS